MKLELKRTFFKDTYVIGHLFIDGVYFCDTIEDVPRKVKIDHETCIPAGDYNVILTMSNRFKKVMPLLLNVPGFEGIRIHSGNTSVDTSGCILVGQNKIKGMVVNSRLMFDKLMEKLDHSTDISISIT